MKKFAIILSTVLLFIGCKNSQSEKSVDSKYKRYLVESGIVKYKTTINGKVMGSTVSGKGESTLYFKNWGALELKEEESSQVTKIHILGQKKEETYNNHSITKLDNGAVYAVDFENKKINKTQNMGAELFKNTDVNKMGNEMLQKMGANQLDNKKFMGYDCEVWDLNGTKQYFYKGIPLKSEMEIMGITTIIEATEAKFDTKVSDNKFELPDFEVVEIESQIGGENLDEMMNSEEFLDDMKDVKENMDALSKMSFKEWKKIAQNNDAEMAEMSDKELKQTYDMMQQMIKLRTK